MRSRPVGRAVVALAAASLLMIHEGARPDERLVLRLWPAPARLDNGTPLWVGTVQGMRHRRVLDILWLWLPVDDDGAAFDRLHADLQDQPGLEEATRADGIRVLRLDTTRGR